MSMNSDGKPETLTLFLKYTKYGTGEIKPIEVSKRIYEKEKIDAIMLCPGFTHTDVSEIFQALEGKVSVNVSRGDGPSSQIAVPVIQREFFNK